jgi:hypothetical protein
MEQPIDNPAALEYNNGNIIPGNLKMIAYIMLGVCIMFVLSAFYIVAAILLFLCLCVIINSNIVSIDPENDEIYDYMRYLGFIKIGKKVKLSDYKYITTMPLMEGQQMYANSALSTTITNSYSTITFFKDGLRGKKVITKFNSKNEAIESAENLSVRLNMKFFVYDPKLVRQVLLGQKSI